MKLEKVKSKYLVQQKSVLPAVQLCTEWGDKKLPTMQYDFTHNAH